MKYHPDKANSEADRLDRERKFCQLSYAKEILTDPVKRKNYDQWRDSGIQISYSKWSSLTSKQCHNSIHWANSNKARAKAITDGASNELNTPSQSSFDSNQQPKKFNIDSNINAFRLDDNNKLLKMFRNYQI